MVAFYLLIYGLFSNAVSSSDYRGSNHRITTEWWIGKDVDESSNGLIWGTALTFVWSDCQNHQKASGWIVSVLVDNQNGHLPNVSLKDNHLSHLAQYGSV
jgi:hypothetical protein